MWKRRLLLRRVAEGLEPFKPHRATPALAQVVAHRDAERVVAIEVPAAREFGAADVAGDVGVVVLRRIFMQALPDPAGEREAVVQLHAAHQVDAVPAARVGQALAVGLVHQADARIAPAPAAWQLVVGGVDVHQFRLVVGGAEGPRDRAVEELPGRLLAVAEPQRILLGRIVLRQHALRQLGAHRQPDAHLVGLVGNGLAGVAGRGRSRRLRLVRGRRRSRAVGHGHPASLPAHHHAGRQGRAGRRHADRSIWHAFHRRFTRRVSAAQRPRGVSAGRARSGLLRPCALYRLHRRQWMRNSPKRSAWASTACGPTSRSPTLATTTRPTGPAS